MDDALFVGGFERATICFASGSPRPAERTPGEHHDRSSPSTSSITSADPRDAIDCRDVRVIHRGQRLRFAREARDAFRIQPEEIRGP